MTAYRRLNSLGNQPTVHPLNLLLKGRMPWSLPFPALFEIRHPVSHFLVTTDLRIEQVLSKYLILPFHATAELKEEEENFGNHLKATHVFTLANTQLPKVILNKKHVFHRNESYRTWKLP